jgi:hypothetical protein
MFMLSFSTKNISIEWIKRINITEYVSLPLIQIAIYKVGLLLAGGQGANASQSHQKIFFSWRIWPQNGLPPLLLVFYEIYQVGDSARCRINFARKTILVCVF